MADQYDMNPEMRKMFEIKKKQRAEAKEYFQKLLYNPYRPLGDGVPFDPLIMRFNSLNTYRAKIYDTTPKFYFKILAAVLPVYFTYLTLNYLKEKKEEEFRSGLIRYEDRLNKFWM